MELIDILDDNGDFTGEIEEYELIHSLGKWHRTAHIWIINSKNELLIQKRSAMKKSNPNKWDISGAGHIGSGEIPIVGALRELEEELGVKCKESDLEYLFTVKNGNPKNREFQDVYLLKLDLLVNEYVLDAEEVTEVKYIYYEELEKMVKNGVEELTMHDEEYARLFEVLYERLRN